MFLQFVDELTPSHLAMLALLNGPVRWMEQHQIPYPGWGMGGVYPSLWSTVSLLFVVGEKSMSKSSATFKHVGLFIKASSSMSP